jgi:hypothetical protein
MRQPHGRAGSPQAPTAPALPRPGLDRAAARPWADEARPCLSQANPVYIRRVGVYQLLGWRTPCLRWFCHLKSKKFATCYVAHVT